MPNTIFPPKSCTLVFYSSGPSLCFRWVSATTNTSPDRTLHLSHGRLRSSRPLQQLLRLLVFPRRRGHYRSLLTTVCCLFHPPESLVYPTPPPLHPSPVSFSLTTDFKHIAAASLCTSNEYLDPSAFNYADSGMSLVAVVDNNVLSAGDQREVRHIEFDWSSEVYDLGDVVMVQPQMPASDRYTVSLDAISILRAYPICQCRIAHHAGPRSSHYGGGQNFNSSCQTSAYSRISFIVASHTNLSRLLGYPATIFF